MVCIAVIAWLHASVSGLAFSGPSTTVLALSCTRGCLCHSVEALQQGEPEVRLRMIARPEKAGREPISQRQRARAGIHLTPWFWFCRMARAGALPQSGDSASAASGMSNERSGVACLVRDAHQGQEVCVGRHGDARGDHALLDCTRARSGAGCCVGPWDHVVKHLQPPRDSHWQQGVLADALLAAPSVCTQRKKAWKLSISLPGLSAWSTDPRHGG